MGFSMFQLEVTVELGGLVPNKDYAFVYVPVNDVSGCSVQLPHLDHPTVFTTGDPSLPSAINRLFQSGATGGGIRVEWDIPVDVGSSGAIFYQVYMSEVAKTLAWSLVYNSTATYFWKTKLQSETPYVFMVSCLNEVGYSKNSSTATLNTTYISVPGPTSLPRRLAATGGMVRLTWDPPEDDGGNAVTHYVVSASEREIEVTTTELSFGGLLANREYTFTVYAGNSLGLGTDGAAAVFSTGNVTAPSQPASIQVLKTSGGSATLAIPAPADTGGVSITDLSFEIYANGFRVSPTSVRVISDDPFDDDDATSGNGKRRLQAVVMGDGGVTFAQGFSSMTSNATVTPHRRLQTTEDASLLYLQVGSLLPTTAYTFALKVGNAAGTSTLTDTSSGITAQVGPPDRPTPPRATAITGGAMTLSWSDPVDTGGVPLTSYTLVVTFVDTEIARCEGIIHSCDVGDLQSLTEYSVVLTAYNAVGASPPSVPVVYTTVMPTQAQAPQQPRVVAVSPTSVTLAWLPCDDFGGNYIESYYVEVHEVAAATTASVTSAVVPIEVTTATVVDLAPTTDYYAIIVRRAAEWLTCEQIEWLVS